MMRVLALGGAGAMGIHACRTLMRIHDDLELVVTDLDSASAARVADDLGGGARGLGLDVTDAAALVRALRQADLVVNTVGPFFRFGMPILRAAIEAGCDYVDICDDWEPTLDMLELDEAAKSAGVTALVGMGASPGVSNLLAVSAARELDQVDHLLTGWDLTAGGVPPVRTAGTPNAAIVHAVEQITGTIRVTRDGRAQDERPLRRTIIDYPGVGRRTVRTIGHPEALTLPAAFPSVLTSLNVTFGDPATMVGLRALSWAVDHGLLSPRRAALLIERAEQWAPADPGEVLSPGELPPLFALAVGTRDGANATVGCALAQVPGGLTMGEVTGIPLGVAAGLVPGKPSGVATPETLLEPTDFFAALAPHCIGRPHPEDMVVTTRSWDPDPTADLHASLSQARTRLKSTSTS